MNRQETLALLRKAIPKDRWPGIILEGPELRNQTSDGKLWPVLPGYESIGDLVIFWMTTVTPCRDGQYVGGQICIDPQEIDLNSREGLFDLVTSRLHALASDIQRLVRDKTGKSSM